MANIGQNRDGISCALAVTPGTAQLTPPNPTLGGQGTPTKGILVGGTGTVIVRLAHQPNDSVTMFLAAGVWHPINAVAILSGGTATSIVAGW